MTRKHLVPIEVVLTANTSQFKRALESDLAGFESKVVAKASSAKSPARSVQQQLGSAQGAAEAQVKAATDSGRLSPDKAAAQIQAIDKSFAAMFERIKAQLERAKIDTSDFKRPSREQIDLRAQQARPKAEAAVERQATEQQEAAASKEAAKKKVAADKKAAAAAERAAAAEEKKARAAEEQAVKKARRSVDDLAKRGDRFDRIHKGTDWETKDTAATKADLAIAAPIKAEQAAKVKAAKEAERAAAAETRKAEQAERAALKERETQAKKEAADFKRAAKAEQAAADSANPVLQTMGRQASPADRAQWKRGLTPMDPRDLRSVPKQKEIEGAGEQEALKRFTGLLVGISQRLEEMDGPLAESIIAARAQADELLYHQRTIEEAAGKQKILTQLGVDAETELAQATMELANVRERMRLREGDLTRKGTEGADIGAARGRERRERRMVRANVEMQDLAGATPANKQTDAALRAARVRHRAEIEANAQALLRDTQSIDAASKAQNERARTTRMVNQQRQVDAAMDPAMTQGTWFQRMQQGIATRRGAAPRAASEFQTGRQFLTSKALTTGGFALSGGLMYGGIKFAKDIMSESRELQQELKMIEAQFQQVDATAAGISFDGFRKNIKETSKETGVAANEVARVERQLAGVFADREGNPDFARAATEGTVALKYSEISGLETTQINDELTAVALAFGEMNSAGERTPMAFEEILDVITDLEIRFGVLGPDILEFTARLAPMGKELGFTARQLAGLAAVTQKASGMDVAFLSEQLGRILPTMKEKVGEIYEIFQSNQSTRPLADSIITAFAGGQADEGLKLITQGYQNLTAAQQNQLAVGVAGKREAGTFLAMMSQADAVVRVLDEEGAVDGAFDRRWRNYTDTVDYATKQMRRTLEEFGQLLFEAGIADALRMMAQGGAALALVATGLATAFRELNDTLGGLPGKMLAVYGISKLLIALWTKAAATGVGARMVGGMAGGFGSMAGGMAAGLTSPYVGGMGPVMTPRAQRIQRGRLPGPNIARAGMMAGGAATSATMIGAGLAPVAAAVAASIAADMVSDLRKNIGEAKETFRDTVATKVAEGVSEEELRGRANLEGVDEGSWLRRGLTRVVGGTSPKADMDRIIAEEYAKSQANLYQNQLGAITDVFREAARADAEGVTGAVGDALTRAGVSTSPEQTEFLAGISDAIIAAYADLDADTQAAIRNLDGFKTDPQSGGYDATGTVQDAGITGQLTVAAIDELIQKIKDNPEDPKLQRVADVLVNAFRDSGDSEISGRLDQLIAAAAGDQERLSDLSALQELNEADADAAASFESSLERLQYLFTRGTATQGEIVALIEKRLEQQRSILGEAQRLGDTEMAATHQAEVIRLEKLLTDETVVAGAAAIRDLQSRVTDVMGRSGGVEGAERELAGAEAYLQRIRASSETNAQTRADASLNVIAAMQNILDERIAEAANPAEVARIIAEGMEIPDALRTDFLQAQLEEGDNGDAVKAVAEALDMRVGPARAMIIDLIMELDGATEVIRLEVLEARRRYWEGVLDALTISSIREAEIAAGAQNELDKVNEVIEALQGIDFVDYGSKIQGSDPSKKDKPKERTQEEIERSRLELEKARAADDPVTVARYDVMLAELALRFAQAEGDEVDVNNATAGLLAARRALGDAISSEAEALRQAHFNLERAKAEGDSIAQAAIDVRAALSQIANAKTDVEKLEGQAALISANNAQYNAATTRMQQEGDYLVALLQGDSRAQAGQQLANANAMLARARPDEKFAALRAVIDAKNALYDAATNQMQQEGEYLVALLQGDSQAQAGQQLANANAMLARARPDERFGALRAVVDAKNAQFDAATNRIQQEGEYMAALLQGDSVAQARQQLTTAKALLDRARPDEKFAAMRAVLDAQRALQASLVEVFIAQKDLAIAVAEGAGDVVRVALLQLEQAQERYRAAREAGLKGAQLDNARADVQRAQNSLVETQRGDRLGDLEYLYEFDRLTAEAYIALLRTELAKIPESNKQARRDIERRIKALREEMSTPGAFNLPDLRLPTLYEVRRLDGMSQMGQNYNDQRQIVINVNESTDPGKVVQIVTDAVSAPPRVGSVPRIY